jgi:hypothetical protein
MYSVRFNNRLLKAFEPSRALHQGDLLSTYQFLFVVDGLSQILQPKRSQKEKTNTSQVPHNLAQKALKWHECVVMRCPIYALLETGASGSNGSSLICNPVVFD